MFEIATSRLLAESYVNATILESKFNTSGISNNHEFLLLGKNRIFFWRLRNDNQLQFQEIFVKNEKQTIDYNFTSFDYMELNDQEKTPIAIIGTKNGSFNVLDTRGGALIGFINFV